jgi:CHAT domain-containing protein
VLRGVKASVTPVQAALEGADLVHLAAHGTFRADAPLFSSLRLADGPLTVYEIERLRAAPDTLVLPSCDAALAGVRPGDELLGTAAALLGLGVASVVAPVLPIPDDATASLMVSIHERLRAGDTPSEALAAAAAAFPGDPVARAFVCIGANERGVATS